MAKNIFKKVFSFGKAGDESSAADQQKAQQKRDLTPYEQACLEGRFKNQNYRKTSASSGLLTQAITDHKATNLEKSNPNLENQTEKAAPPRENINQSEKHTKFVDTKTQQQEKVPSTSLIDEATKSAAFDKISGGIHAAEVPDLASDGNQLLAKLTQPGEATEPANIVRDVHNKAQNVGIVKISQGNHIRLDANATNISAREVAADKPSLRTNKLIVSDIVSELEEEAGDETTETHAQKNSWFERLKLGLSRSSRQLGDSISSVFTKRKLDEDTLQDLEDVLIQADLGLETAMRITDSLASGRYGKDIATDEVRFIMSEEIKKVLEPVAKPLELELSHKPHIILVVGVNGTGKTTTIGKLAAKLTQNGLKVMLAAGDTFRAAAIEQLHIWGERTGATVFSSKLGADAASLAFDAFQKAKENGSDVLIIDTAGRLQNKTELMDELAKIVRVIGKIDPDAPHTVLQTLDATTGQNALNQVEIFRNIAGVNGLVMTKLDGTARGGILVAIAAKYKLPVHFIGVGEGIEDLEPFAASDFAEAIAGRNQ